MKKSKLKGGKEARSTGVALAGGLLLAACSLSVFSSKGPQAQIVSETEETSVSPKTTALPAGELDFKRQQKLIKRVALPLSDTAKKPVETAVLPEESLAEAPESVPSHAAPTPPPMSAARTLPALAPATMMQTTANFIVKFRSAPDIEEIIRLYHRDPEAAKAQYDSWKQDHPVFKDTDLVGATYSGEALLSRKFSPGAPADRAAIDEVLNDIREAPNVAYCDPDFTAQPGDGGN